MLLEITYLAKRFTLDEQAFVDAKGVIP